MDERLYWLWLQYVLKTAGETKALIDIYGCAKSFYEAGEIEWSKHFGGTRTSAFKRCRLKGPEDFSETAEFCDKHNLKILTPESEYYPKRLLSVKNYPAVLFVRGDYRCLNEGIPFGVIGTRTPCKYSENAAKEIVGTLTENGALVVSGGALGVDSIAHKVAIAYGGKTVLVMGCGHGYNYLKKNADLRKDVTRHGACISEYPPFTPVTPNTFPERNRIISGLSSALVIIEAAEYSGTLSTAGHAKKQGRDIFVLPGDIGNENFAGSNNLISEGATAVTSGEDIIKKCDKFKNVQVLKRSIPLNVPVSYSEEAPVSKKTGRKTDNKKPKKAEENKKAEEKTENIIKNLPAGISKNAEMVYNIMSDGINELDEIKRKSQLEVRHILVALTELEMLGFAEAYAPNCYRIK